MLIVKGAAASQLSGGGCCVRCLSHIVFLVLMNAAR